MAGEFRCPAAEEVGRRGRELSARVVPGQCQSEPHSAATPGPAAPVNKARTLRALVAFLMGFAREFPLRLRREGRGSERGRADAKHPLSLLGTGAQFADGAPSPQCILGAGQSGGGALGSLWGTPKVGRDRVCAQQVKENDGVRGQKEPDRRARAQERPVERAGAAVEVPRRPAGSHGAGAGVGRSEKERLPQRGRAKAGQGVKERTSGSPGHPRKEDQRPKEACAPGRGARQEGCAAPARGGRAARGACPGGAL